MSNDVAEITARTLDAVLQHARANNDAATLDIIRTGTVCTCTNCRLLDQFLAHHPNHTFIIRGPE